MKSILKTAFFVSLVVLALVGGVVVSQMVEAPVAPQEKMDHIPPTPIAKEWSPAKSTVELSKPDDAQQVAVGRLLGAQTDPPTRASYFQHAVSTLNSKEEVVLKRWHLKIVGVNTLDGVTTATVRATPQVTAGGGAAVLATFLDETYEVNGEDLKLIKSETPANDVALLRF